MKRTLAAALILGAVSGFGLVGCSDETKQKDTSTISGPDGTQTVEKETKIKTSGNPPVEGAKTPTP